MLDDKKQSINQDQTDQLLGKQLPVQTAVAASAPLLAAMPPKVTTTPVTPEGINPFSVNKIGHRFITHSKPFSVTHKNSYSKDARLSSS